MNKLAIGSLTTIGAITTAVFMSSASTGEPVRLTGAMLSSQAQDVCESARDGSFECVDNGDCDVGFCSRSWNPELAWVDTAFGHCVDVDGEHSATAAIQADLCGLPDPVIRSKGVPYRLPPGRALAIDDHDGDGIGLHISRRVILEGSGAVLYIDADSLDVGVRIRTAQDTNTDPHTSAIGSTIRDLSLVPLNLHHDNGATGLLVQSARVGLSNIRVQSFKRCIVAEGIDADGTNANFQHWERLYIGNCIDHGILMTGGDVQEGLISQVHISGGAGITEDAEAGNVWIAPTTELAHPHSLRLVGGSGSTVIGMALEVHDPVPEGGIATTWVGGSAIQYLQGNQARVGPHRSQLTFRRGLTRDSTASIRIPGQSPWSVFQFRHDLDQSAEGPRSDWILRFDTPRRWFLDDTSRNGEQRPLEWSSP